MFSGATRPCGRNPTWRANRFGRWSATSRPSRRAAPDDGVSSRTNAFSNVDFPHALGPTMAVNEPSGTARLTRVDTTRSP